MNAPEQTPETESAKPVPVTLNRHTRRGLGGAMKRARRQAARAKVRKARRAAKAA